MENTRIQTPTYLGLNFYSLSDNDFRFELGELLDFNGSGIWSVDDNGFPIEHVYEYGKTKSELANKMLKKLELRVSNFNREVEQIKEILEKKVALKGTACDHGY